MRTMLIASILLLACSANAEGPDRAPRPRNGAPERMAGDNGDTGRVVNVDHDQGIMVLYDGREPLQGSGNRVRQVRPAGAFTRVIADDAMDVEIRIGPRASIELEGDDNLIGRIRTDAERGTLHLRVSGGYRVRRPMLARITMPRLDRLDLEASGDGRVSGLNGGRLALASFGSGSFTAEGRVEALDLRIQGSGDAALENLRAGEARILINGSGDASAHVVDTIVATVNGTGEIVYRGEPRHVTEEVNGTGRISRRKN